MYEGCYRLHKLFILIFYMHEKNTEISSKVFLNILYEIVLFNLADLEISKANVTERHSLEHVALERWYEGEQYL